MTYTLQKGITKKHAEPQIYTLIAIKTRIEITPSTPAKCCKHLTNQRKSSNFKSDFDYYIGGARPGPPGPAKLFLKFNWAATLTFDSIFYSGAITCFVYPSANRTQLLQERTGHLGAQPVETHLNPNCFSSSLSFVLIAILNSQAGCRCTLVPRLSFPVPRSPFPVPRSPFPVLVTSNENCPNSSRWIKPGFHIVVSVVSVVSVVRKKFIGQI